MSFLGFKVCLASDATGIVLLGGKPIKGAKITRQVLRDNKEYIDEVMSDEKGSFSLPALYGRSFSKYLPIQPTLSQKVTILYEGVSYLGWELVKMDWEYLSEINSGKSIQKGSLQQFHVVCELSNESLSRYVPDTLRSIHGKCRLENEL